MSGYLRRQRNAPKPESGQDSFLDIISNMVGIMIILVMVAGVRVGSVTRESTVPEVEAPVEKGTSIPPEPVADPTPRSPLETGTPEASDEANDPKPDSPTPSEEPPLSHVEKTRYVEVARQFESVRDESLQIKREVDELNEQMTLVKNEADGADVEYQGLVGDIAAAEATIDRLSREKEESELERITLQAELDRLTGEADRLAEEADRLAKIKPKPTVLENMPTPLTKKVEGNEGVFALKDGKITHVPIGYFAERVRGYFRSMRDLSKKEIEETMGPVDGYLFRFHGSLHQVRGEDGRMAMMVVFDEGEFLPDGLTGETLEEALAPESEFRHKLALYLKESSVITLSVYPDSFALLREVKKFLLENGYTLAIRPMPAGKNITISPDGTESTTY